MSIYAIADLHLSLGTTKPMDVFSGWEGYTELLKTNWNNLVNEEDTVVLPGDISWSMKLEECYEDFNYINQLPGRKIIIKGNHDYWWTSLKKMQEYLNHHEFNSISILHNNSFLVENVAICGTRSWLFERGEPFDQKVVLREAGRLIASLESAGNYEKIVFLHYPPIFRNEYSDLIIDAIKKYNVKSCYYGHLHSHTIKHAFNATADGIKYRLVSADALNFSPLKIR